MMMVVVLGFGVPEAYAGWVETFDSYATGPLPTIDWALERTGASQQSVASGGYGGTGNAIQTLDAAAQYRAAGGGAYQLTARLRGTTDQYDVSEVGFCAANADDAGFDLHENSVTLRMNNGSMSFFKYDAAGARVSIATQTALDADTTWYDVRLTVDGLSVHAEFRESDVGGTWWDITMGTADAGFAPNYVGIYGSRGAQTSIDDVVTASDMIPQTCAEAIAMGYGLDMDLTDDCYVNLDDLALFVVDWLRCDDPEDPSCEPLWP